LRCINRLSCEKRREAITDAARHGSASGGTESGNWTQSSTGIRKYQSHIITLQKKWSKG
jgi:hypothetical protein